MQDRRTRHHISNIVILIAFHLGWLRFGGDDVSWEDALHSRTCTKRSFPANIMNLERKRGEIMKTTALRGKLAKLAVAILAMGWASSIDAATGDWAQWRGPSAIISPPRPACSKTGPRKGRRWVEGERAWRRGQRVFQRLRGRWEDLYDGIFPQRARRNAEGGAEEGGDGQGRRQKRRAWS